MSAVTKSTIVSQCSKNVQSELEAGVTASSISDPRSGSRGSNQDFIRLTEARAESYYPHVLVKSMLGSVEKLGIVGDSHRNIVLTEIIVVANNSKDVDEIMDDIVGYMQDRRTDFNAYGMRKASQVGSVSPYIRDGDELRKTATYRFKVYT